MTDASLTIYDATPAIADRKAKLGEFSNLAAWVRQTPAFRRVAERYGIDADTYRITVHPGQQVPDRIRPAFASAGAVCCVYLTLPCSAETVQAGGGAHTSVIGLSSDGCRAIVHEADEWTPTAEGNYPWPTYANAL